MVPGQEQVVGIIRGEGKDADAGSGQGHRKRLENAGLGEIEGPGDAEAAEAALGSHVRGDGSLQADDGELRRGARDRYDGAAFGPRRDRCVRFKP